MRNIMPITRPMGAADLTQAAEDAGRYALALSDLSRAVAAYEAATGVAIAVVDADKAVSELVAEPAVRLALARARLDALDAGKLPMEIVGIKGADPVFEDPAPTGIIKKFDNALPTWQGKTIPADLRDAVQHLAEIGASGPKWGFAQDFDMIERAIDGQNEKLIADVMEFSPSHIRQRFNKLVDRTHARGNRFTRDQIRDALQWMLGKTHTA